MGDATAVFWSERNTNLEKQVRDFSEPPKDDPDRGVKAVASLFKAVETGAFARDEDMIRFFVLGMTPFGPRIAVRFWIVDTVSGMAGKICQHFEDTRIVHGPRDKDTLSVFRLLVSTAAQGESKNIPPNLGGDMMRAILEGLPYPQTFLQAAIRRIRAEHDVSYPHAALIKPEIGLQDSEIRNKGGVENELRQEQSKHWLSAGTVICDTSESNQEVYAEGQEPNSTIRDRYYAQLPEHRHCFGTLIRLSKHHLAQS